jgi:hypothetical protein
MPELEPIPVDGDETRLLCDVERARARTEERRRLGDEPGVLGFIRGRE